MARTDPRNRAVFRVAPGMPGVSLLTADFTTHEYTTHAHDTFVFAVTEAGGASFRTRHRTDQTRPDALLVFNPEEAHASRLDQRRRWRYRALYVASELVREVAETLGFRALPAFACNQIDEQGLVAAFGRAHEACAGEDRLAAGDALHAALARLLADHCSGRRPQLPSDDRIGRVIDYVRAHYAEDLSLEDLARQIDLSPFQLCRSFRRALGMPPYGYVTQIRLRAAIRLMRGGLGMAEAATAAGFYDQAAMNRHFKRTHGFTPRQLLNA